MSANRGKDTNPEMSLRRALRESGLGGYRLHWKKVVGRPDISYPGRKVAVFVQGCFWHRCPHCNLPLPKMHRDFWNAKFERNMERDRQNLKALHLLGWNTVTVWECEIENDLPSCVIRVGRALGGSGE
jgi:DNA mismatch endonuclease (patch repair protein)